MNEQAILEHVSQGSAKTEPQLRALSRILPLAVGLGVLSLSAQVRIPVPGTPVPMTLQLLVVLFLGLIMPVRSVLIVGLSYLILGSVGVPLFSPGSGGLLGPTGGYLTGFVVAMVMVAAMMSRRNVDRLRMVLGSLAGVAIVFLMGAVWQVVVWRVGPVPVFTHGVLPFLPKAAVEAVLAVVAARKFRKIRSMAYWLGSALDGEHGSGSEKRDFVQGNRTR